MSPINNIKNIFGMQRRNKRNLLRDVKSEMSTGGKRTTQLNNI